MVPCPDSAMLVPDLLLPCIFYLLIFSGYELFMGEIKTLQSRNKEDNFHIVSYWKQNTARGSEKSIGKLPGRYTELAREERFMCLQAGATICTSSKIRKLMHCDVIFLQISREAERQP